MQPIPAYVVPAQDQLIDPNLPLQGIAPISQQAYMPIYPQYGYPEQYVNPQMMYAQPMQPYYPAAPQQPPVLSLSVPKMEEVVDKLLSDFENTIEDQSGCRFLQKQLEDLPEGVTRTSVATKIYNKMAGNIGKFMCMSFGNYLCQKLFEVLGEEQLYIVLKKIKGSLIEICKNMHGTRSFQHIIKIGLKNAALKDEILKMLKGTIKEIVMVFLICGFIK